jgi:hypothetical protein
MAKKHRTPNRVENQKQTPVLVTDLRAVEAIHREEVGIDLNIGGQLFRFSGHRLIPSEANRVKHLMELAIPPLIPGGKETGEPRYNFNDPDYMARREEARRTSRALALWLGYPCFQSEAERLVREGAMVPGVVPAQVVVFPKTEQEIMRFIESRAMDDDALELLFVGMTRSAVTLAGYINFTSGNASRKS